MVFGLDPPKLWDSLFGNQLNLHCLTPSGIQVKFDEFDGREGERERGREGERERGREGERESHPKHYCLNFR
jgi:hypothetical protein